MKPWPSREVVIVGHGPSTVGAGLGKEIDKFKRIVRLKVVSEKLLSNSQDYGTRRDILCGSWTIREDLHKLKAEEYWIHIDSRHSNLKHYEITNELTRSIVLPQVCHEWTKIYLETRTSEWSKDKLQIKSPYSDTLGTKHMSSGMYSILYACWMLQPTSIALVGFDNVTTGSFSKSLARPDDFKNYGDHRWDTEKVMLDKISNHFCVNIRSLG